MMEQPSHMNDGAFTSTPDHPDQFHLAGIPLPLAGLDDTYWIAKATWIDGQRDDEGFLIYADATHYLFLDQKEAYTAARVMRGEQGPRPCTTSHPGEEVGKEEATEKQGLPGQTSFPMFPVR